MTKQTVIDISKLNVQLDAEDEVLFSMIGKRENDDLLIINESDGRQFIMRKSEIAKEKKYIEDITCLIGAACSLLCMVGILALNVNPAPLLRICLVAGSAVGFSFPQMLKHM